LNDWLSKFTQMSSAYFYPILISFLVYMNSVHIFGIHNALLRLFMLYFWISRSHNRLISFYNPTYQKYFYCVFC